MNQSQSNRKKSFLPALVPMALGFAAALVFLVYFMSGNNKAVLTIRNGSGTLIPNVEAAITSSGAVMELGFLKDGDSAVAEFKRFPDGAYVVSLRLENGTTVRDTLGNLSKGRSRNDEIVIENADGAMALSEKHPPR